MKIGGHPVLLGVAVVAGVCMLAGFAGARVNTSKSIPVGLYWISSSPVEKGSYVLFCPPEGKVFEDAKGRGYIGSGFCPGGYGYMMKKVLAAGHDVVSVSEEGVQINGEQLPLSAPLAVDGAGQPLPRYRVSDFMLGDQEVLLMSDVSATSFDGRYFGIINRKQIRTVIRPVWVWSDNKQPQ